MSMNCKGLQDRQKRNDVFNWLRQKNADIYILQETHSDKDNFQDWRNEWGHNCFFSSHQTNSRGVAILFNSTFSFQLHRDIIDNRGRYIILDLSIYSNRFSLVGIYAPNEDCPQFFKDIETQLEILGNDNILIGGDWNVVQDYTLDTLNYKQKNNPNAKTQIEETSLSFDLTDIWRYQNPNGKMYTWRGPNNKLSRIDYFLITENLIGKTVKTDIKPGYRTDHSLISISIDFVSQEKGRGVWKLNNSLLEEERYTNLIKATINETLNQYRINPNNELDNINPYDEEFSINDQLLYETLKLVIRGKTIKYASTRKKIRQNEENNITRQLDGANQIYQQQPTEENRRKLDDLQNELIRIRGYKMAGIMTRSKAKWYTEGERCTKYFCNLENKNYTDKIIQKLILDDKTEITKVKDILEAQKNFYQTLYKTRDPVINNEQERLFLDKDNPFHKFLSNEAKVSCDRELNVAEITESMKKMKSNKSPGSDGFTVEFYRCFWTELHPYLYRSYKYAKQSKNLSITQKQGMIGCLPKPNKPKCYMKNWRPITLLNVDYKILSSAIASRLKPHLDTIVSHTQKGYIKGRYIGEATRLIYDVIEETENNNIPALLLSLDFEKAFDSVEWSFLLKVLQFYGLGDEFCEWVKIFYTDIKSCILYNGHSSAYFSILRGVRQGDPLAAYLFILVLETLSAALKYHPDIHGVTLNNTEHLLSQYADDSTVILDGEEISLKTTLYILGQFAECSGLKANIEKTEAIWLGSKILSDDTLLPEVNLKWNTTGSFTLLGIEYNLKENDKTKNNYEIAQKKIESLLSHWSFRKLTLIGKITVIKTLALAKLVHLLMVLPESEEFIENIQRIFFRFIWDKGRDRIARQTMYLTREEGGLKVPNVAIFSKSLKLIWIKKLMDTNDESGWKMLFLDKIDKIGNNTLWLSHSTELNKLAQAQNFNPFWKSVIRAWADVRGKHSKPTTAVEVLSQTIWRNSHIKIQDKTIFYHRWHVAGVNFLNDLVDENGKFLTVENFRRNYNVQCNFLQYCGVIHAIPREWKNLLPNPCPRLNNITIKDLEILKGLKKPTKYFYPLLIGKLKQKRLVHKIHWERGLDIIANDDEEWRFFHTLPFMTTKETKLQTFQFNISHNSLITNSKLKYFGIRTDNRCTFCNLYKENILHLLYECNISRTLWLQLMDWLNRDRRDKIVIQSKNIILGIRGEPNDLPLNHIILLTKYYLYKSRCKNIEPTLKGAIADIEECIKTERQANIKDVEQKWRHFSALPKPLQ